MFKKIIFLLAIAMAIVSSRNAEARSDYDVGAPWLSLESDHFFVHFPKGTQTLAQWVLAFSEEIHGVFASSFQYQLAEKTHILLVDHTDITNGFAMVFPYNSITLHLAQPSVDLEVTTYRNWMEELLVHELTHIYAMDATRGIYQVIRDVFGKHLPASLLSILFAPPNHAVPNWFHEGLAVWFETRHTPRGRLRGSRWQMIYRMLAYRNQLPDIETIHPESKNYPEGGVVYLFGARFLAFLAKRFGDDVLTSLVDRFSGRIPYLYNFFNDDLLEGQTFKPLYYEMLDDLTRHHLKSIESLRQQADFTAYEVVANVKNVALMDYVVRGSKVYYLNAPIDGTEGLYATDLTTLRSQLKHPVEGRGDGQMSVSQSGDLYYSDIDVIDNTKTYNSLKKWDHAKVETVVKGKRLRQVDIHNGQAIAVQNHRGIQNLVLVNLVSRQITPLTTSSDAFTAYANPRFSPDGTRVLYSKQTTQQPRFQLYIMNLDIRRQQKVMDFGGDCIHPDFMPSGRSLLFSSDRNGVSNLYHHFLESGLTMQVTHLPGGAFYPHVIGEKVYFTNFESTGYQIVRMPLARIDRGRPPLAKVVHNDFDHPTKIQKWTDISTIVPSKKKAEAYRPFAHVNPRAWLPIFGPNSIGEFGDYPKTYLGVATSGEDPLAHHMWEAEVLPIKMGVAVGGEQAWHRPMFDIAYRFDALLPTITMQWQAAPQVYAHYFDPNEAPFKSLNNISQPNLDYWTYIEQRNLKLSYFIRKNKYRMNVDLSFDHAIVKPDYWMQTFTYLQEPLHWAFQGQAFGVGLHVNLDTTFRYRTRMSLYPYSGHSLMLGVEATLARTQAQRRTKDSAWIGKAFAGFEQSFSLFSPLVTGRFSMNGGTLFGVDRDRLDRRIFGQFLGVGGWSTAFPVRGRPDYALRGTRVISASIGIDGLILPVFRSVSTWYWFSRHVTAHAFIDYGSAWGENNIQAFNEYLSSIGGEIRYNFIVLKYFPVAVIGIRAAKSLNSDDRLVKTLFVDWNSRF